MHFTLITCLFEKAGRPTVNLLLSYHCVLYIVYIIYPYALSNVKKGDRDVSGRFHSFLPTFGVLRDAEGNTIRKVKFIRQGQIKTCPRCGGKERKAFDEDDSRICPAEGDVTRCNELWSDFTPTQEEIWDYWVSRAGNTDQDPHQQPLGQIRSDSVEVFNIHIEVDISFIWWLTTLSCCCHGFRMH